MPESRDRLSKQDDSIIASYSQRRVSRTGDGSIGRGIAIAFVLEDDNEEGQPATTPFRWRDTAMTGSSGSIGTPRNRQIAPLTRPGNLSPVVGSSQGRGRGRGRGGVLPAWYPRKPLNDITAVVRAMERRRDRGDLIKETPHEDDDEKADMMFSKKRCPPSIGKVPKILLDITHQNQNKNSVDAADSLTLTAEKKLLNSLDTVEKVVMDELLKLKRTPSAKKAEREKRVRTLLSMR